MSLVLVVLVALVVLVVLVAHKVATVRRMTPETYSLIAYGFVIFVMVLMSIVSFALLTPLDSVNSVTSASLIIGLSYAISLLLFGIVVAFYGSNKENLIWLLTAVVFLVCVPATISATTMNVVTVQNTRNLLASKLT